MKAKNELHSFFIYRLKLPWLAQAKKQAAANCHSPSKSL